MTIRPRAFALLAALAALLLVAGCAKDEAPQLDPIYFDLADELPSFEDSVEDSGPAQASAETGSTGKTIQGRTPDLAVRARGDGFVLPAGGRAAFLLMLEAESALHLDGVSLRGSGELTISLETDEAPPRETALLDRSAQELVVDLTGVGPVPARLVLEARGGEAVVVERAVLRAPGGVPKNAQTSARVSDSPDGFRPADVVVYLIDTLRRDHLGCYGRAGGVTPEIDAFANRSTLFLNAVGQSTWTKPSMASVFTGVRPLTHGTIGWEHKLAEDFDTIAEVLREAGYKTVAFVSNPHVGPHYGLDQGFDEFFIENRIPSAALNERVFAWLDAHRDEGPFFVYVHTMDPHAPYEPPEEYRKKFAPRADALTPSERTWTETWKWPLDALPYLQELYLAEVASNDASFGALLDGLRARGLYDDAFVALLSDHGEEFQEHGRWRHGAHLHAETVDFPLIVKFPEQQEGRRVDAAVQHVDLMPSLLDALGLAIPARVEGRSWAAAARPDAAPLAESPASSHIDLQGLRSRSLVDGDWKLIRTKRPGRRGFVKKLYHRGDDPGETVDLSNRYPIRTALLVKRLLDLTSAQAPPAPETATIDENLRESLQALGYLND